MIKSKYNDELGFYHLTFHNEITSEELITFVKDMEKNSELPKVIKILTETDNAKVKIDTHDLPKIINEAKKAKKRFDLIIHAVIINKPFITALGFLYQKKMNLSHHKLKIFSDKEAAIEWLIEYN